MKQTTENHLLLNESQFIFTFLGICHGKEVLSHAKSIFEGLCNLEGYLFFL